MITRTYSKIKCQAVSGGSGVPPKGGRQSIISPIFSRKLWKRKKLDSERDTRPSHPFGSTNVSGYLLQMWCFSTGRFRAPGSASAARSKIFPLRLGLVREVRQIYLAKYGVVLQRVGVPFSEFWIRACGIFPIFKEASWSFPGKLKYRSTKWAWLITYKP